MSSRRSKASHGNAMRSLGQTSCLPTRRRLGRAMASLLGVALIFPAISCGSASSSGLATGGCRTEIRGAKSKILPRTSGYSCGTIQAILLVLPSTVGTGPVEAGDPKNSQVCRVYPKSASPLEVRCHHGSKYFEVVAESE
jgi:hypothetical protein